MHPSTHTFVALLQDRPGALNRVVSLLRRRGLNIAELTVHRAAEPGVSHMTLVVECEDARPVLAQMEKLIDVLQVHTLPLNTQTDGHTPSPDTTRRDVPSTMFTLSQADGVSY